MHSAQSDELELTNAPYISDTHRTQKSCNLPLACTVNVVNAMHRLLRTDVDLSMLIQDNLWH